MTEQQQMIRGAIAELRRAEEVGLDLALYHVRRAQVYALLALSADPDEERER